MMVIACSLSNRLTLEPSQMSSSLMAVGNPLDNVSQPKTGIKIYILTGFVVCQLGGMPGVAFPS